jgi:hypothetical protein
MTAARIINTLGLTLVLIGCALLYHFGLPPNFDPSGKSHLLMEETDHAAIAKGKRYRFWGRVGLVLIATGSLFQICATWIK